MVMVLIMHKTFSSLSAELELIQCLQPESIFKIKVILSLRGLKQVKRQMTQTFQGPNLISHAVLFMLNIGCEPEKQNTSGCFQRLWKQLSVRHHLLPSSVMKSPQHMHTLTPPRPKLLTLLTSRGFTLFNFRFSFLYSAHCQPSQRPKLSA